MINKSLKKDLRREFTVTNILVVAVVAIAVNINSLWGGFVFDDRYNVLKNPWVLEWSRLGEAFTHNMAAFSSKFNTSYYRPVMHVILASARGLFNLRAWGFHLVLILLHAAASLALFALLTRFFSSKETALRVWYQPSVSLVGALLFAVLPVHSEAVAWISGVVDVSYSLFFLFALLAATSSSMRIRLILAPLLFFAALSSKEPAVMLLPVLAALYASERDFADHVLKRRDIMTLAALAGAFGLYIVLRVNALGGLMGTGGAERVKVGLVEGLATAIALFGAYMKRLVIPVNLSALHDFAVITTFFDHRVIFGLAVLLGLCYIAWRFRQNSMVILGIGLLVFPLLPALYVPVLGEGLLAERYLYLPSAGFILLLVTGWNAEMSRSRAVVWPYVLISMLFIASCVATASRNRVWHDDLSLWSDAVAKTPRSAAAHEYMGFALYESGDYRSAITSLSQALEIDPKRIDARVNLAAALARIGRTQEAISQGELILIEHPGIAEVYGILGFAFAEQGRLTEAELADRRALAIDPYVAGPHNQLGIVLAAQGDLSGAASEFREAMRIEPNNPNYARNLGLLQDFK